MKIVVFNLVLNSEMLLVSRMSKGKLFQTVTEECEKIDADLL